MAASMQWVEILQKSEKTCLIQDGISVTLHLLLVILLLTFLSMQVLGLYLDFRFCLQILGVVPTLQRS